MKIVKIKGTPYEMGLEYGMQCKKEIHTSLSIFYLYGAMSLTPGFRDGHPKTRYILPVFFTYKGKKKVLRNIANKYEKHIQQYAPHIIEEMKGIAKGAEVDYRDILYLNAFPEIVESCSIWLACGGASHNGETLLAMNTDEMKRTEKTQVFLIAEPENAQKFTGTTFAGIVAPFQGMNQNGLAGAAMLLNVKRSNTPLLGISQFVLLEMIFSRCSTVDDAVNLFEKLPRPKYGLAIFLADEDKAVRIEIAPEDYDITIIKNDAVGCCMRPLSKKIRKYDATLEWDPRMTINAVPRTKRMQELLTRNYGNIDVSIMMEIARDHGDDGTRGKSICQHGFAAVTIGSFIAKPKDLKMWICHGSPCKNKYTEFTL